MIALKAGMSSEDKLLVYAKLDEIKMLINGMDTSSHDDQKWDKEE